MSEVHTILIYTTSYINLFLVYADRIFYTTFENNLLQVCIGVKVKIIDEVIVDNEKNDSRFSSFKELLYCYEA